MKLCSACLLGVKCRYNGTGKKNEKVLRLAKSEVLIPVCPEQLGGLSTPRSPVEKVGSRVKTKNGEDITERCKKGAREMLRLVKIFNIREAILKQESPTCGCGRIYDGSFTGTTVNGDGIATELLKKNGIKVISEEEI